MAMDRQLKIESERFPNIAVHDLTTFMHPLPYKDYDAFVVDSVNEPYLSGILQFA